MTVTTSRRRTELAAFLRSRRERITPADVGVPAGLRRRTPGLRREEVAQLAGVGVTWYTWLEQGRPINVSVQVLDAIARTLRLDQTEREHLYRLAAVPSVPGPAVHERLEPQVQTVLDGLVPLPAAVLTSRYDVLAWNAAYAAMWPKVLEDDVPRNLIWRMFVTPECCSPMVNRDEELPQMVATFRGAFGRHLGETSWTELVHRLSSASPEFAEMWAAHDVAVPATRVKIFQHASVGVIRLSVVNFAVTATPETRMAVYTPVDAESRERVQWLIDHPGAPAVDHVHAATIGAE
ncbi:helix-turn-helix transcriptional regulator [Actinoallomurus purpureus]|uniref:helix-turn-helix transcriptional regulator n=1 Tax=Actinoallomurus purpureus TaxID=478114 RepID=UPI002093E264|nr:helix-turn-helix transcriptional regulator [Actinoallomurus purpureus]MCO6004619.1 helix-turn-helix transcriptional regulator [Actinoallomurus purpureus]